VKLAIFGATGTVGTALLPQALDAGHELRVLARTPAKVGRTDPRLRVIGGNANDLASVTETVTGCDAVLTTLGGTRDPDSIIRGTTNIITAMPSAGIRRLVVMQGFHLTFPGDPNNLGRKLILPILHAMSRHLVEHSTAMAAAVQASDLEWTVVRAPRVVVGGRSTGYRTGILRLGPWNSVTNADVADFMLTCLARGTFLGQAPMVAA
jgi:uncharacterized protein YbjT (DUF2867 family)